MNGMALLLFGRTRSHRFLVQPPNTKYSRGTSGPVVPLASSRHLAGNQQACALVYADKMSAVQFLFKNAQLIAA